MSQMAWFMALWRKSTPLFVGKLLSGLVFIVGSARMKHLQRSTKFSPQLGSLWLFLKPIVVHVKMDCQSECLAKQKKTQVLGEKQVTLLVLMVLVNLHLWWYVCDHGEKSSQWDRIWWGTRIVIGWSEVPDFFEWVIPSTFFSTNEW